MHALLKEIDAIPTLRRFGRVARIEGLLVEVTGAAGAISLGGQVKLSNGSSKQIPCEVVGFRDGRALVMPLGNMDGMSLSARADFDEKPAVIYPSKAWLGRVIDAFGEARDGKGVLPQGSKPYSLKAQAPAAHARGRVGAKLDLCSPCFRATRMQMRSSSA
jgi:flagellum-specific ATP synthase